MKDYLYWFVIGLCMFSCKPYSQFSNKDFLLINDTYENDTLYLQDFVFCGTFKNLRYMYLFRNHPIPYKFEDIWDLMVQNLNPSYLVIEKGSNKSSYYLCSNAIAPRNNEETLEELKYLFPQKDDKIRVVPHINFIEEFSVGKTMSPIGFYLETINLRQDIFMNIFFIRNGDIHYMNNIRLMSKYHQIENKYADSFPFFDLEKIDEIIGEVLKEYFERVES
ncbi:MAG: hypothetical protein JJU02_10215 [Cryomorphaceae bacterium]|nr:hypothetical protein [Cryomorphaceae bacterium]